MSEANEMTSPDETVVSFTAGLPPDEDGHYWLRVSTTDASPVTYEIGQYACKCECHPDQLLYFREETRKNLSLGLVEITGFVKLPDPKN